MITVLIMFSIVIVYVIIYKTNHYLLTHKESPWTYPRLHKMYDELRAELMSVPFYQELSKGE